jgi:hypothetical protein
MQFSLKENIRPERLILMLSLTKIHSIIEKLLCMTLANKL